MSNSDSFQARANSFEEGYFRTKDAELVDKLRKVFEAKRDKDELSKATGIKNDEVLDRLMNVNIRGEMLTVFKLYPLVEIAWADGSFDKSEGDVVIAAAIKNGIPEGSAGLERVKEWLRRGPNADARAAWYMYAAELRSVLSPAELDAFRNDLLKMAKQVAETSGGVLNMFFTVSSDEQKVLAKITEALSHQAPRTSPKA